MVDGCSYQGGADSHFGAIHLHGAESWRFDGVEVAATGQYGVFIEDANTDITLSGCFIHDIGAGGVRVGIAASGTLPDPAQLTTGVVIEDCTIADGGRIITAGEGLMWQSAAHGTIRHNEV